MEQNAIKTTHKEENQGRQNIVVLNTEFIGA